MIFSRYYRIMGVMLFLLFLPSFVYVVTKSFSMAPGLTLSLAILLILVEKEKLPKIKNKYFYLFFGLFLLHYIYIFFFSSVPVVEKQLFSLFIIFFMMLGAALFSLDLQQMSDKKTIILIKKLSMLIIFLGFFSQLVTIDFSHYSDYKKAVFPFSEPSHYILATGGILFASGFFINQAFRIILVSSLVLLAIMFPSTLLVFLSMLMIFNYYFVGIKKTLILVVLMMFMYIYVNNNLESFSYFFDRLNIDSGNQNITYLVYLQGWDDAYRSLVITNGIGFGFQNMGLLPPSDISNLIYSLAGYYKNRTDGGFLMAKIIAEFGVLGLMLVTYYLFRFYKSIIFLRNLGKTNYVKGIPSRLVLGHSIVVVFFLEMFVRGYGYFSPSVFLVFLSFFMLRKSSKNEI